MFLASRQCREIVTSELFDSTENADKHRQATVGARRYFYQFAAILEKSPLP